MSAGFSTRRRGDVEPLGHLGVVAADRQRAVLPGRELEHVALGRHDAVVEHHGEDGDAIARGGLDVHAGHADGGVAHDVDAELVRRGELGAHDDAEPVAELGRLAPAHIGAGRRRLPERQELFARAAGIVRDDDVVAVDGAHEIPDHAILVDRHLVGLELLGPFRQPRRLGRGHLLLERGERIAAAAAFAARFPRSAHRARARRRRSRPGRPDSPY